MLVKLASFGIAISYANTGNLDEIGRSLDDLAQHRNLRIMPPVQQLCSHLVAMLTRILNLLMVLQLRRLQKWILPMLNAVGLAAIYGYLKLPAFILER